MYVINARSIHVVYVTYTHAGNERLQEMMDRMAQERGGKVYTTDERYVSKRVVTVLISDGKGSALIMES